MANNPGAAGIWKIDKPDPEANRHIRIGWFKGKGEKK
jgi:hypothetical protein